MQNYSGSIPRVGRLDDVRLEEDSLGNAFWKFKWGDKEIKLDRETKKAYDDALNPGVPFRVRARRFLTANNQAGRTARLFKDAALVFLPFGEKVNDITELVAKQIERTMPQKKEKTKSRTIRTFILLGLAGAATALGWIPETVELSPDAGWVAVGSSILGIGFRLITGKPVHLGPTVEKLVSGLKDE